MPLTSPSPETYGGAINSLLFAGPQYANRDTPLWCPYPCGGGGTGGIGPNIQVSTITVNAIGDIYMDISGNISSLTSAEIQFARTADAQPVPFASGLSMTTNTVEDYAGAVPAKKEILSVTTNGKVSHDGLAVGDLYVYGNNDSIGSEDIQLGTFTQYQNTTDLQLNSSGFHLSSLYVSSINGGTPGGGGGSVGPDPKVSTLTVNQAGYIKMDNQAPVWWTAGPNPDVSLAAFSNVPPSAPYFGLNATQNVAVLQGEPGSTGEFYGNLVTGTLNIYDTRPSIGLLPRPATEATIQGQIITTPSIGGITINSTRTATQNLIVSSINGYQYPAVTAAYPPDAVFSTITTNPLSGASVINDLNVSTINGLPYSGGGIAGPNLQVSTLAVNAKFPSTIAGGPSAINFPDSIYMRAVNNNNTPSYNLSSFYGAPIVFESSEAYTNTSYTVSVVNNLQCLPNDGGISNLAGQSLLIGRSRFLNSALTQQPTQVRSGAPLMCGSIYLQEDNDRPIPGIGGIITPPTVLYINGAVFQAPLTLQSQRDFCISTFSTIIQGGILYAPTARINQLSVSSIIDYAFTSPGTVSASTISTTTTQTTLLTTSTLKFTADLGGVDLGGIDLGMGGFLGGLTGQLLSGSYNTIISGVALGTGTAALINSRNNLSTVPPPGGNVSSFTMVNGTTQLQFSTLGTNTDSYYRFTSSVNSSLVPGPEQFISSIIPAGTVCIRSYSDPINPANPSTFRSTLQSYGQWVPLPPAITTAPANITTSTILLTGNTPGIPGITAVGYASINGVTLGSISGAIAGTTLTLSGVGASISAPNGTLTTGFASLTNIGTALTVAGQAGFSAGTITLGAVRGVIAAQNVNASQTISATQNIQSLSTMNAPVASFSTINVSTIQTTGPINITGGGNCLSIQGPGNYVQSGGGSFTYSGTLGSFNITSTGATLFSASNGLTTMINCTGRTQTTSLSVLTTANLPFISTCVAFNGGQFSAAAGFAPQFNSGSTPQIFAPFAPGGTTYFVSLSVNSACTVRVFASASRTNPQQLFPPIGGCWDVVILYYNSTMSGIGYRAQTQTVYSQGITLSGAGFVALGSPVQLNIINTSGTSINELQVAYHSTSFIA